MAWRNEGIRERAAIDCNTDRSAREGLRCDAEEGSACLGSPSERRSAKGPGPVAAPFPARPGPAHYSLCLCHSEKSISTAAATYPSNTTLEGTEVKLNDHHHISPEPNIFLRICTHAQTITISRDLCPSMPTHSMTCAHPCYSNCAHVFKNRVMCIPRLHQVLVESDK